MIALTGATGQLGSAFRRMLPDALLLTRTDLDLTVPESVGPALDALRPTVLVNCAAYTAVDQAESDEVTAHLVNAHSVEAMARWAADNDARFVTFSTDYVFDGRATRGYTESDPVSPINAYGRSKLAGEQYALGTNPNSLVIRTSWVISATHSNFVTTMIRLNRERELRVVDDQTGCPTVAADLARGTLAALEAGATGVLHLSNQSPTTWFGLARAAVTLAGGDPTAIHPCTTAEFPRPAPRPANSVLRSERLEQLELEPLPDWRSSLPALVEEALGWV